jgi:hypothetical protein
MPLIHNDPEHWRKRAEEARKLANEMTDPVGKKAMLEIAVKLTRFRGHPNICVQGVHNGVDETTLHPGIPSPDGRAGPRWALAGGAGAGV